MIRVDAWVRQIKRGWEWLVNSRERQDRQMQAFIVGDRVEIRYRIGQHVYLLRYKAELYEDAVGYAYVYAREPGPFTFEDAETVLELIYMIADWNPKNANTV